MSYLTESLKPRSGKVVLCTLEAKALSKIFTLDSGSQYYKNVDHIVSSVYDGLIALTEGTLPLSAGQFYFSKTEKKLYIRTSDSVDPKTKDIIIKYKFFFSSSGHNLPFDLLIGESVNWDGRLISTGAIRQELDDENSGVVTESQSTITLINSDGFFDEIFDTLIWENQPCEFWSWITSTPVSQAQKLFSGVIEDKSFDPQKVVFKVKDFTFKLKDSLSLGLFSESDGILDNAQIGKAKRRIFGKADNVECVGTDRLLNGREVLVSAQGSLAGLNITFGSSMLGIVFTGDEIQVTLSNGTIEKIGIDGITSGTVYTVSSELDFSFNVASFILIPSRDSRNYNREFFIVGHKLSEPQAEILNVISGNRYECDDISAFFSNDAFTISGESGAVLRTSLNTLTTKQVITPRPIVGDIFSRLPIYSVKWEGRELLYPRDYSYLNTIEARITIDPLAEFNLAPTRTLFGTNLTFTNGSRDVTSSSTTLDLQTILRPRDWVRSTSPTHTTWYEVAQVSQFSLKLVSLFGGTTGAVSSQYKSVDYIGDDSIILVSCYGLESAGQWIKTASDSVKYILENDASISLIDTASFTKANAVCDYVVSLVEPEDKASKAPLIRDVISKINTSVLGSLYTSSDFLLSYSILNSTKPSDLAALNDDDILSFTSETKNQITNKFISSYAWKTDEFTGSKYASVYEYNSDFTNKTSGIKKTENLTLYLYNENEAIRVTQRHALIKSLPLGRVKVKSGQNLSTLSLNDKLFISLDRIFKRYGGQDRRKIGIVSSLTKDGFSTEVEFNDLGGIFNRVPAIAPTVQSVYGSASRDEIAKFGFILDNNTNTPSASSDAELGNILIG